MSQQAKAHFDAHYAIISSDYDKYYLGHYVAVSKIVPHYFSLSPDDALLDLGGGTGEISHLLWKQAGLKRPVLCVDPAESMLEVASKKEGVTTLRASAEEFFSNHSKERVFNKVLMVGSYHHFTDPSLIFDGLSKILQDDGVCIIVGYTDDSAPPLFEKARQLFEQSEIKFEQTLEVARSKGFKARLVVDSEKLEIPKEICFGFLRNRMYSTLSKFTDKEIEEGIEEIEENYKGSEIMQVEYKLKMIIVTK